MSYLSQFALLAWMTACDDGGTVDVIGDDTPTEDGTPSDTEQSETDPGDSDTDVGAGVARIVLTGAFACAETASRPLWCWTRSTEGGGDSSQNLGDDTVCECPDVGRLRSLAAGGGAVFAVDERGKVHSFPYWGVSFAHVPSNWARASWLRMDGYANMACGLSTHGDVRCLDSTLDFTPSETVARIAPSASVVCVVATDGAVSCPSNRDLEALLRAASGAWKELALRPDDEPRLDGPSACGLTVRGAVACVGPHPVAHGIPDRGRFTQIRVGAHTACALRDDGEVRCWGEMPIVAQDDANAWARARGGFLVVDTEGFGGLCGVAADGDVACWGTASGGLARPFDEVDCDAYDWRYTLR